MILTIIKTVIIKMMLSTNLENNVLSVPQLHHHVASLPVHIPRLITMVMMMTIMVMRVVSMVITVTMTMMSIADSTVHDTTARVA